MRPRFPALATGRILTHAEHLAITEINRHYCEIDAARERIVSMLRSGMPLDVSIVEQEAVP